MKISNATQARAGFSLIELLTTIAILGIIVAIVLPHFGNFNSEAEGIKDKRNAQVIVLAYATGDAAGVQWPSGNVATKVAAVLVGQHPPGGVFKSTRFQASLTTDEASKTYRYISANAEGDLFVDPVGGQNPTGQ